MTTCALCPRPAAVTVTRYEWRVAFRTDHLHVPQWADQRRCVQCATDELELLTVDVAMVTGGAA